MHLSFLLLLLYFCFTIDGFLIPHTSQLKCLYISRFHHLISSSNNVIVLPVTATTVHHRTRSPLYYYRSTQAPVVLKGPSFSRLSLFSDEETIEFSSSVQFLLKAALLGATTGFTVHLFKYLISLELTLFYENLAAVLPKPVLYWPFIIYPVLGSLGVSLLRYWKGDALSNGVDYIAKSLAYQLPVPVAHRSNKDPPMFESTYEPIEPVDNLTEFMSELESAEDYVTINYNSSISSYDIAVDVPSAMPFKSDDSLGGSIGGPTLLKKMHFYSTSAMDDIQTRPPSTAIAIFNPWDSLSRVLGAIFTLGSGCSLGPEGPSVELGVSISRVLSGHQSTLRERHHLFLAGTAAGVAAGFSAPVAGILFAIECGSRYLAKNGITLSSSSSSSQQAEVEAALDRPRADIAAICLAATTASIAVQIGNSETVMLQIRGEGFMDAPLVQLPLYLGLGIVCGAISLLFSRLTDSFKDLFNNRGVWQGEDGIFGGRMGSLLSSIPVHLKPIVGGLVCGIAAVFLPQTLFVGYAVLDQLIAGKIPFDLSLLLEISAVKMFLTTFCLGSGLIGGTFAPSLFLGALAGTAFHRVVEYVVQAVLFISDLVHMPSELIASNLFIAGAPVYATVGAAAMVGAVFRAPLTASMIMYELTQNHDIVLPVLASTGLAGLVADILAKPSKTT